MAGDGTNSGEFLKLPVLSRGAALGGSLVATAAGTEGLLYNPATIGLGQGREVSLSHNELYQDLRLESAALSTRLSERVALGVAVTYLGYGEISGYDVAGNATGAISAYSTAVTIGGSWMVSDQLFLGAAVKPLWESLGDYSARTAAFDLGLHWRSGQFTVGAQAANFGGSLKFAEERNPLPRLLRVGAAYQTFGGSSLISLAATSEPGSSSSLGGGVEYNYTEALSLRAGYTGAISGAMAGQSSLSLGLGLRLGGISVDYAYRPSTTLDDTHQITLIFR